MHQQVYYFKDINDRGEVVCQAVPRGMTLEHVSAMVREGNPARLDLQVGERCVLETVLEPGRLVAVGRQGFAGGQYPHVTKGDILRVRVASLPAVQALIEGEKPKAKGGKRKAEADQAGAEVEAKAVSTGVSVVITLVEG